MKKGWRNKAKRSGQNWKQFEEQKKAILRAAAEAQAEKQQQAAAEAREAQLRMEAIVEAFGPSDAEEDIDVEAAPQDDGDNEAPEEHQLPENSKHEIKAFEYLIKCKLILKNIFRSIEGNGRPG